MSTVFTDAPPTQWTIADVQSRLAGVPSERIRTYPAPGTATEEDLLEAEAQGNGICELIDGILVEKPMASYESSLAAAIIYFLYRYLETRNLGTVLGEAGFLRLRPGQVRAPDVSFIRWERFSGRQRPTGAIYPVAPDLAVEILSESNRPEEMQRKRRDYFAAGTRLVWYIEPTTRTARAYTAENQWTEIGPHDSLTGGEVLPGFELPLQELFARVEGPGEFPHFE
jgi:Uma2 family endonuclease